MHFPLIHIFPQLNRVVPEPFDLLAGHLPRGFLFVPVPGLAVLVPFDSLPFDPLRFDSLPFDSLPFDPLRFDSLPFDPLPFDPLPFDPLPFDPLPFVLAIRPSSLVGYLLLFVHFLFDPLPVDPLPVDPLPVDPLPFDSLPVVLVFRLLSLVGYLLLQFDSLQVDSLQVALDPLAVVFHPLQLIEELQLGLVLDRLVRLVVSQMSLLLERHPLHFRLHRLSLRIVCVRLTQQILEFHPRQLDLFHYYKAKYSKCPIIL